MAETWRVVLASGEVLSVEAWTDADGVPWARHRTASGEDLVCSHTPREAVVRAVAYAYSGIVEILAPGEPTRAEMAAQLTAVTAERDVLRAQQAPLVALFDEVMAAARMAGLRGAGHEPAEVVLAVRRLGACEGAVVVRDAAMSVADDLAPDGPEASDCEWAHELMHRVAAAVARIREGGE